MLWAIWKTDMRPLVIAAESRAFSPHSAWGLSSKFLRDTSVCQRMWLLCGRMCHSRRLLPPMKVYLPLACSHIKPSKPSKASTAVATEINSPNYRTSTVMLFGTRRGKTLTLLISSPVGCSLQEWPHPIIQSSILGWTIFRMMLLQKLTYCEQHNITLLLQIRIKSSSYWPKCRKYDFWWTCISTSPL